MSTESPQTQSKSSLIFITWSGEVSRQVGLALYELIRSTIQIAAPWISETDIDKGAKWRSEIQAKLEAAQTGIIVLTPDNLKASWLVFESGALSNKRDRVYTYLVGLNANQVGEPLDQFQGTVSAKPDTLKMVKSISRQIGAVLDDAVLTRAFEHNWKEFEDSLEAAKTLPISSPPAPEVPAMLGEALAYLREQSKELAQIKQALQSRTFTADMYRSALDSHVFSGQTFGNITDYADLDTARDVLSRIRKGSTKKEPSE